MRAVKYILIFCSWPKSCKIAALRFPALERYILNNSLKAAVVIGYDVVIPAVIICCTDAQMSITKQLRNKIHPSESECQFELIET